MMTNGNLVCSLIMGLCATTCSQPMSWAVTVPLLFFWLVGLAASGAGEELAGGSTPPGLGEPSPVPFSFRFC